MAVLADYVFFDGSSTGTTSDAFALPYGTTDVLFQVEAIGGAEVDIRVKGSTETGGNGAWADMGVLNMGDLSIAESIDTEGIFTVWAGGIRYIQLENGAAAGTVRVHGTAVGA